MILILAGLPSDAPVTHLAAILRLQGADVPVVTPDLLERPSPFSIDPTPRGPRRLLSLPNREVADAPI